MAVIESSRGNSGTSPLAQMSALARGRTLEVPGDHLAETGESDEPETHERESAKVVHERLISWIDNHNIARDLDPFLLGRIGDLVVRDYEIDEQSRAEWKDDAEKALDFATQKHEPKEYPWPEASSVVFPLITSASLQFNARTYPAIVQNRNVVKGVVWGDDKGTPATQNGKADGAPEMGPDGQQLWIVPPGEKKKRADRVGEHMSWQLLEQMEEWEGQTDTLLTQMPIVGGAIRKTFRDARKNANRSLLVPLMKLVWSMHAPSFETAPRHTEIQEYYPHEIETMERDDEQFIEIAYGPGGGADSDQDQNDSEAAQEFLEQHRRYDLDNDGYAEPLTITVHKASSSVVRIVACYEEDGIHVDEDTGEILSIDMIQEYTLYPFLPNPKGGSYPVGFGHLLKPLNEAINTTINQMFDAGHLQIAGGGFIGAGLNMHAGPTTFSMGEFKPVNNKGTALRDNIFTMPWPGPNAVLFQLLGFLVSAAKEVASIQDILTGDAALANTPPTTMLALIEQGQKVYTAIHKRVFRALKCELGKLYRLNRLYLTADERYRIGDTWREVTPQDYRLGGGVEPIADPTMTSDSQRLGRAALIVSRAKENPLVNPLAAEQYLFEAAQIANIDNFLPDKMPAPQASPEQQLAQQEMQIKLQTAQSKMGQERALELMQYTQAMLNFQKAKSEMSGPQLEWYEKQLDLMRMHIEALNTTVKAAAIDAHMHATKLSHHAAMTGHAVNHARNLSDVAAKARETANEQPGPADNSGGGGSPADIQQPGGAGNELGGIPAMAPSPGNSQLPALSGPLQPGAAPIGGGPVAGGNA
jgi:chaperonin GroES